ncbi:hypothetical protein FM114_06095 [Luteococcus japonicus LSP_Lj1]|uniref:Uncharacterized protein n=1 Tax=Luteococcus japonicus LSP_Lj1 TaxID=1255658 RepID=A0A1R4J9E8_9ACTN|nr:hypothetical protein FM114_06095 [Luteococcus japonicus LSP_Lj1]
MGSVRIAGVVAVQPGVLAFGFWQAHPPYSATPVASTVPVSRPVGAS